MKNQEILEMRVVGFNGGVNGQYAYLILSDNRGDLYHVRPVKGILDVRKEEPIQV